MEIKPILSQLKLLDELVQFVLNLIWRLFRKLYSRNSRDKKKILIISLHKIGDSVFTMPAIKEILNFNDPGLVYLVVYKDTKIIFKDLLHDSNIISLEKKEFLFENRFATPKARKIINFIAPETIIDLTGSITSATLIYNNIAKKTIGMNEKYYKALYSDFTEIRNRPHLTERYYEVAELFIKQKVDKKMFNYPINIESDGKILIHPLAGWAAKEWGLLKYISLAKYLQREYNTSLIFPKFEINEEVIYYLKESNINFIQTNSLSDLISEIEKCSLFVGNDSGPLYLANKYGKPTFTIYGPTNPEYSKPFGNFHLQIRKTLKCSPIETQYCYLEAGRKCPTYECMTLLDQDLVTKKVLEFILFLSLSKKN